MNDYEVVIGLETHIQLNTTTKIFCACKADSWFDPPNTNICPVCTGMPGVLPVLNKAAVEKGVVLASAMHAELRPLSFFDRKNYFYPDLPKGFQISQFDQSLAFGGYLDLPVPAANGQPAYIRKVTIHKLHLEEDAGKTKNAGRERLIDFNRCGVPLVEMVTGPDLRSADEAAQYLIRLRQLLRWLGVSEADMEKGHLRCDANVSIRLRGVTYLNPKTEIKNVNSIEAVRSAIEKEVERQIREVEAGGVSKPGRSNGTKKPVCCARCAPRKQKPITATSVNRICCRFAWMTPGRRKSSSHCPNCHWYVVNALWTPTACPNMTLIS